MRDDQGGGRSFLINLDDRLVTHRSGATFEMIEQPGPTFTWERVRDPDDPEAYSPDELERMGMQAHAAFIEMEAPEKESSREELEQYGQFAEPSSMETGNQPDATPTVGLLVVDMQEGFRPSPILIRRLEPSPTDAPGAHAAGVCRSRARPASGNSHRGIPR